MNCVPFATYRERNKNLTDLYPKHMAELLAEALV